MVLGPGPEKLEIVDGLVLDRFSNESKTAKIIGNLSEIMEGIDWVDCPDGGDALSCHSSRTAWGYIAPEDALPAVGGETLIFDVVYIREWHSCGSRWPSILIKPSIENKKIYYTYNMLSYTLPYKRVACFGKTVENLEYKLIG